MFRPTWYPAACAAARTFPLAGLVLSSGAGCVRVPGAQACVGVVSAGLTGPADAPAPAQATASVCVDLAPRGAQ